MTFLEFLLVVLDFLLAVLESLLAVLESLLVVLELLVEFLILIDGLKYKLVRLSLEGRPVYILIS